MTADAIPDPQSLLTLGGEEERGCESRPFGTSLHNLRSHMPTSAGKRTLAAYMTGEYRTTEPLIQTIGWLCKRVINHDA